MFPFDHPTPPPRKHQKTKGYLMFSGGITRKRWEEMDCKEYNEDLAGKYVKLTIKTPEKGVKYVQG